MHRFVPSLRLSLPAAAAALCVSSFVSFGCTTNDGAKKCEQFTTSADLTTPEVSFKTNIVGDVFLNHCAFSGCHGDKQILFLGFPKAAGTQTDPAEVYANIVGKPSGELSAMNYVTAGDPTQSYMMHKMDGDLCLLKTQCKGGDCGDTMPHSNDLLDVPTRDVLRRWIKQGAKNN
jgi:hypothetical protein